MPYRTHRRAGFTLIEMLIVLVIIAQLTAIILPVFSRARESARRASCAGNLKQIGLGIELYAADNDDYYPNKILPPSDINPRCAWADRILPYTKNTQMFLCPSASKQPYEPGCPADNLEEKNDFGNLQGYDGAYSLVDLSTNAYFPHAASFTHPSSTASVLDGRGIYISPINKDMTTLEGLSLSGVVLGRHSEGWNMLFLDGHVKWTRLEPLRVASLWKAGD